MNAYIENEQHLQEIVDVQRILDHWHERAARWNKSYLSTGVDPWGNDWGDVSDDTCH